MRSRSLLPDLDDLGFADVEELNRQLHRRRVAAGLVAAALSLGLHLLLALRMPAFGLGPLPDLPPRRAYETFQVADVAPAPPPAPPDRPDRAAAGAPGEAFDAHAAALAFSRAVDEGKLTPVPVLAESLERAGGDLPAPPEAAETPPWSPREMILSMEERLAREPADEPPRRLIPDVPRVKGAPDVALPSDTLKDLAPMRERLGQAAAAGRALSEAGPPAVRLGARQWERLEELLAGARSSLPVAETGSGGFGPPLPTAAAEEARLAPSGPPMKPVEQMLQASLKTWTDRRDPDHVYARIDISRAGADLLPVLPKDVLFIQDTSGSITDARLEYCRQGLLKCLAQLDPRDRFNIVQFKDRPERLFPDWAPASAERLEQARAYVRALRAKGTTDLAASLRELLAAGRTPGRPVVAILITDGLPTVGERDSAVLLSEFAQANAGAFSVFVLAVYDQANMYLIDMLSYMNRGDSLAARRGRWSIPEALDSLFTGLSRPVLGDMRFRFSGTGVECYPALTPNLYLDRALVLYGRFPRGMDRVVFQVVGLSGDQTCDMVFDLPLVGAARGEAVIREEWGWHKVYALIGAHTRTREPALLEEMARTAAAHGLTVPYAAQLPGGGAR